MRLGEAYETWKATGMNMTKAGNMKVPSNVHSKYIHQCILYRVSE
jgi:hypothetical protein